MTYFPVVQHETVTYVGYVRQLSFTAGLKPLFHKSFPSYTPGINDFFRYSSFFRLIFIFSFL